MPPAPGSCAKGAGYCDTFANPSSGWADVNRATYHAFYTKGGFYSIGETDGNSTVATAPKDITDLARDYSIRVDVDVNPAAAGRGAALGVQCWRHQLSGSDAHGGFDLMITPTAAQAWVNDEIDGVAHRIASRRLANPIPAHQWTHLTFVCGQAAIGSGTDAVLLMWVNHKEVLRTVYAQSVKTYDWKVGPNVGLRTDGAGTVVYFDNFAMTSMCKVFHARSC